MALSLTGIKTKKRNCYWIFMVIVKRHCEALFILFLLFGIVILDLSVSRFSLRVNKNSKHFSLTFTII